MNTIFLIAWLLIGFAFWVWHVREDGELRVYTLVGFLPLCIVLGPLPFLCTGPFKKHWNDLLWKRK